MDENHVEAKTEPEDKPKTPSKRKNKADHYKCDVDGCLATFSRWVRLIEHSYKHTGVKPFTCAEIGCSRSFTKDSHLRAHALVHNPKPIPCSSCEKVFANRASLNKHCKLLHNPERLYPFTCSVCNKGFSRKRTLNQHSFEHTGVPYYGCDKCEERFMLQHQLNTHKKVKHRRFACECKMEFERGSAFRTHRKTCIKKETTCVACKLTLKDHAAYKRHMETHQDAKDRKTHKCTVEGCDRSYLYKRNLTEHIMYYHNKAEKPLKKCSYQNCDAAYTRNSSLLEHVRKKHLNEAGPKKPRKKRKDVGTIKKSIIQDLTGVKLTYEMHQQILHNTPNQTQTVDLSGDLSEQIIVDPFKNNQLQSTMIEAAPA